ncbi:hypothetical protein [Natronorubrum sp. DTA7]|uniref:hypothetical protein n=1 Tax=Natronorubrum sp. DTA7 TaxID=3447016 RepID=UPI003F87E53B
MIRRGDDRAVTVQIGAILLLAIVFSALALYQVNAVPEQNRGVEFDHNERVEGDLLELRDSILTTGTTGTTQGVSIELGTQYESRVAAVNPPHPTGTLQTIESESNVTIEYPNSAADDTFETRQLVYEPGYHEYQNAPRTVVEHSLVYNEFDDAAVSVGEQQLIGSERITLLLLDGDLHEQTSGTASVSVESLDPVRTKTLESGTKLTLPTERIDRWTSEIDDTDGVRHVDSDPDDDTVTIELETEFELEIARVGVGSGGSSDSGFSIRSDRSSGDGNRTTGQYDISFDGVSGGAATCDSEAGCNYYVSSGSVASFEAIADAEAASFDFAYETTGNVTMESFDEDRDAGTVQLEATGDGTFDLFVSSGGSGESITVDVRQGVVVRSVEPLDPVEAGADLDVEITVENLHADDRTQNVTLLVDGDRDGSFDEVDSSEETIGTGETETVTLTYRTQGDDSPQIDVRGATDEDADGVVSTAEVYELDDLLDVRIVNTNAPVTEGETLEVTADVRQTWGADVTLEVDGDVVDATSVNEDGEVTLTWETNSGDAGDRTIIVTASGWFSAPSDSEVVTVDAEPDTLSVDEFTVDDQSGNQVDLDVDWTVSDSDGALETVTVSLENEAGDEVDSQRVDVSGTTASGETELRVRGNPDAQTYTVTVTVSDGESEIIRTETVEYAG